MIKASLTHLAKNEGVVIPMAICISIRTRFRFFLALFVDQISRKPVPLRSHQSCIDSWDRAGRTLSDIRCE